MILFLTQIIAYKSNSVMFRRMFHDAQVRSKVKIFGTTF
jgi:hypothetical protein